MHLSQIGFCLDPHEFPTQVKSDLLYRSRCLFNFLSRRIRPIDIDQQLPYSRICVYGSAQSQRHWYINFDRWLTIHVPFNVEEHFALSGPAMQEHFIASLVDALSFCQAEVPVPIDVCSSAIGAFRNAAYRNRWLQSKKSDRSLGVRAELWCELSTTDFTATVTVRDRQGEPLAEAIALCTKPDELFFHHRIKALRIEGGTVQVLDRRGAVTHALPIHGQGAPHRPT